MNIQLPSGRGPIAALNNVAKTHPSLDLDGIVGNQVGQTSRSGYPGV